MGPVHIIGGGLYGSEAAWQLAARGIAVVLHEMRPVRGTEAHKTDSCAELVVPLIESGECLGVLDLHSPQAARFDEEDKEGCEALVGLFLAHQRAFTTQAPPASARRRSR